MSIRPHMLDNRERDIDLSDREGKTSRAGAAERELKARQKRIDAVRFDRVRDRSKILAHAKGEPACGDCFARGFVAAVSAVEDGIAINLKPNEIGARDLAPHNSGSFLAGWTAAANAIEG